MRRNFLKTIYFDKSQLGQQENIEKLYEDDEEQNHLEKMDTKDDYIKNIPIFNDIEELELNKSITYFV
jgi:predicted ATPase